MKKDIKFSTRMASADREKIRALAAKAHMSMSDYVTACCLGKRIIVIDEQKELLVTSVFPGGASATPTDKLLQLIDTKLEREHHEQ